MKASADYQCDGQAVSPTAEGVRLRCVFQRLEAEATREGLWLTSTVTNAVNDRFCVVAVAVERGTVSTADHPLATSPRFREVLDCGSPLPLLGARHRCESGRGLPQSKTLARSPQPSRFSEEMLPPTGLVSIDGQTARFTRPGLVEEYSVSMDGVRQDFVVPERPRSCAQGRGELALQLAVSGARVEPAAFGAHLVLENSGRKIA